MNDNALRFWVTLAALLFISLLADASAPRWLIAVPLVFVGAYAVYAGVRYVRRERGRG